MTDKINLTYGFELEGVFDENFAEKVSETMGGQFKDDGSVSVTTGAFTPYSENACQDNCGACDGEGRINSECECDYECGLADHDHISRECDGENKCELPVHCHSSECYPCYYDGNYHRVDCLECGGSGECNCEENEPCFEYASDVFDSLDNCLRFMGTFVEGDTYVQNETCGLHFHIGSSNNWAGLKAIMCNFDFQKKLFNMAKKFCKCQSRRLGRGGNSWCRNWGESRDAIREFHSSSKYWFMNFHSQRTLEFRFLSPCVHKVENVRKLVKAVEDYINSSERVNVRAIEPEAEEKMVFRSKIEPRADIEVSRQIRPEPSFSIVENGSNMRRVISEVVRRQILWRYLTSAGIGYGYNAMGNGDLIFSAGAYDTMPDTSWLRTINYEPYDRNSELVFCRDINTRQRARTLSGTLGQIYINTHGLTIN